MTARRLHGRMRSGRWISWPTRRVDGTKLRILTVIDASTRLSPAIDARKTYWGIDVVETLERITAVYGKPKRIRVDQGTEFTSKDVDLWAWKNGVVMDFSRPGKPTDNACAEAFNSRVRAELLIRALTCDGGQHSLDAQEPCPWRLQPLLYL